MKKILSVICAGVMAASICIPMVSAGYTVYWRDLSNGNNLFGTAVNESSDWTWKTLAVAAVNTVTGNKDGYRTKSGNGYVEAVAVGQHDTATHYPWGTATYVPD